jgi:hypothetical protein
MPSTFVPLHLSVFFDHSLGPGRRQEEREDGTRTKRFRAASPWSHKKKICAHNLRGECRFGSKCHHLHEGPKHRYIVSYG